MARNIPFRIVGRCIDCSKRTCRPDYGTLRCKTCDAQVLRFRTLASKLFNQEIRAGRMRPASELLCVDCEAPAEHYDHRDYRRLLDVVPVCRTCNFRRGPAYWRAGKKPAQPTDSSVVGGDERSAGLVHAADSLAGH